MWSFNIEPGSRTDAQNQINALAAPQQVKDYLLFALSTLPDIKPGNHYKIVGIGDGKKADVTCEAS